MLKLIIGLLIMFVMLCTVLTVCKICDEANFCIPKFMTIIGMTFLVISGIGLILFSAYIIGGCVLGN